MADPAPLEPASHDNSGGTPTWAKVFGVIAAVVIVVFVILLVAGGDHGPGRHGGGSSEEPPAGGIEHTAPEGGHAGG